MKPDRHVILAVHVTNRVQNAQPIQSIFSEYGCYIKTRLGLHEASPDFCSTTGIILLELLDNEEVRQAMERKLDAVEGVQVQSVVFDH